MQMPLSHDLLYFRRLRSVPCIIKASDSYSRYRGGQVHLGQQGADDL